MWLRHSRSAASCARKDSLLSGTQERAIASGLRGEYRGRPAFYASHGQIGRSLTVWTE